MSVDKREIFICDECGSEFFKGTSQMERLCPGMCTHPLWLSELQPCFQEWQMPVLLLGRDTKRIYQTA